VSTWLGFDFGLKRIGVAVGESLTGGARALRTIGRDWPLIQSIIREWGPDGLVVGLPLNEDGSEQAMTRHARGFATELHQRTGLPVYTCDERYSSLAADEALREARRAHRRGGSTGKLRKSDTDQEAARILLQQWLIQDPKTRSPMLARSPARSPTSDNA
jgi:putative Holliday junction resolvase